MAELSHDDAVYLAALIDGEGTIAYRPHHGRPFPYASIHVYNTCEPLMDWLASIGGHVARRAPRTFNGPVGRKPMFIWQLTRQQDVAYVLRMTLPYFRIKGARASETLEALSHERIWDTSRWSPPVWRGEASANAKLNEPAVRLIRTSQESVRSLARRFGVSRRTIGRARDGLSWAHVDLQLHPGTVH
jgi:hypothetical protein